MAEQGGPEHWSGDEGNERRPQLAALEERVARLELEIAALQRKIAAGPVDRSDAWRAAPAERSAPPPAPPPMPVTEYASGAQRLVSEAWGEASSHAPTTYVPESRESLESRLGSHIFNRIAIMLLLIGTACFLKLAVDRQWIVPSPTGRVIAGLLAGAGLVLWSERFRRKDFAAFSYSLKAVGSGVLYLSLWAAFQLYGLIPAPMAMGLMILVTAWNAYMAWAQDAELLAAYALAGGFATPLLVSTGGNHEIFLFTYLLAIDLATVALVRLKSWPRLLFGAFPLTVAFFIAWYAEFYAASELATTAIFIALFGSAFASVAVRESAGRSLRRAALLEEVLLPLANAAFVALAFYSVLEDSGHHALLPWMMVALAAAYLGLMRAPQSRTASAIHLSLAVVLLTIAVPLKASGHWITVSWLVEGLALLWVAARLEPRGVAGRCGRELCNEYAALAGDGFAHSWILRNLRPHRRLGGCDRVATAELGDRDCAHRHRRLRGGRVAGAAYCRHRARRPCAATHAGLGQDRHRRLYPDRSHRGPAYPARAGSFPGTGATSILPSRPPTLRPR